MGSSHQPANDFPEGQNQKHCWWLFQCWRSEERSNNNPTASITPTEGGTGHQEHPPNKLAESEESAAPASDEVATTKGSSGQAEEDGVDKEAQNFIDKVRRKIKMEALKSMKRYESMIHRGY